MFFLCLLQCLPYDLPRRPSPTARLLQAHCACCSERRIDYVSVLLVSVPFCYKLVQWQPGLILPALLSVSIIGSNSWLGVWLHSGLCETVAHPPDSQVAPTAASQDKNIGLYAWACEEGPPASMAQAGLHVHDCRPLSLLATSAHVLAHLLPTIISRDSRQDPHGSGSPVGYFWASAKSWPPC